jgi:Na+-translocating ferredoxin:NAD+ oxidoreductase RnfG subunit
MKIRRSVVVLLVVTFTLTSFTNHSKKIEKKVNKEITNYLGTEEFSTEIIKISEKDNSTVKSEFGKSNLLKIVSADGLLGYAYIGNAPSKTATFDYLVIFDEKFSIVRSKVLIYREEYGGEIGSKRWLKQFIGKTIDDQINFPEDIDAISGATISVRSMTKALGTLLKSIKALHLNEVI